MFEQCYTTLSGDYIGVVGTSAAVFVWPPCMGPDCEAQRPAVVGTGTIAFQGLWPTFVGSGGGGANNGQQQQNCLNEYSNSKLGKAIQLASPLQVVPGWGHPGKSALETLVGVVTKATVIQAAAGAGQPAIQTLFSDAWNLAGPLEQLAGEMGSITLSFAKVAAPVVWIAGLVADVQAHAACAGYYDNQQVLLAPTVF